MTSGISSNPFGERSHFDFFCFSLGSKLRHFQVSFSDFLADCILCSSIYKIMPKDSKISVSVNIGDPVGIFKENPNHMSHTVCPVTQLSQSCSTVTKQQLFILSDFVIIKCNDLSHWHSHYR